MDTRLTERQRKDLVTEARARGVGALAREFGVSREAMKSVLVGTARAGSEALVCLGLSRR